MSEETLYYIRKHPHIYQILREESHYYQDIFQNNNFIYELDKIAKEKYKIRWVDKVEKIGNKINLLNTFIDLFQ